MKFIYLTISALFFIGHSIASEKHPTNTTIKKASFLENKGQIIDQNFKQRNDIDFKLDAGNITLFIGNGQLHYQWSKKQILHPNSKDKNPNLDIYRMDVTLLGANKNAEIITKDIQPYYENYYLPAAPDGVTARSYRKITYKNIYPYIDWVLYTTDNDKGVKYDFVIHPGGNPANIQMQYKGATSLKLENEALICVTPFGNITEDAPVSYYTDDKEHIVSHYKLNSDTLSFEINASTTRSFIIDPLLQWTTYYGGSSDEGATGVAADTMGNVYLSGITRSTNNIATTGAFQITFAGGTGTVYDGFVVKMNGSGVRQWATYYGGTGTDEFQNICTDSAGNIYITGRTNSAGLATTGAHQTSLGGSEDAILIKFDQNGMRQWATYYGGSLDDDAKAIAVNGVGNIFIGGTTASTTGIATSGSYLSSITSGTASFITMFSSSGIRQWGTYYAPSAGSGTLLSIAIDPNGYILAAGNTTNGTLATPGVHQTSISGFYDSYIAKFTLNGQQRIWATYYGGSVGPGGEMITNIACDGTGNVYVCGNAVSTNNIASTGAYQTTHGGGTFDGFLAKLSPIGTRLWGTYYGGSGVDNFENLVVTPDEKIYLWGASASTNMITINPYSGSNAGGLDGFFAIFKTSGTPYYATYYGGTDNDRSGFNTMGYRNCSYGKNSIYVGGTTRSSSIATFGAHQTTYGGVVNPSSLGDAYLIKFGADTSVYLKQPFADTVLCAGDTMHVPYDVIHNFRTGNTYTIQLSNASGSFASPTTIGTISNRFGGQMNWVVPTTITSGTGYMLRIIADAPADTFTGQFKVKLHSKPVAIATNNSPICSGNTLNLTGNSSITSGITWSWVGPNSFNNTNQSPSIASAQTIHSGDYILTVNFNGCIGKDTTTVLVKQTPATPTASNNGPLCNNGILNLTANSTTPSVSYDWSGPSFTSTVQNPVINPATTANSGTYSVFATLNGCNSGTATTLVTVLAGPTVNIFASPNDSVCVGASTQFSAVITNAGIAPSYQWLKNGNPISGATGTVYTTSTLATGDVISFLLTPGAGAACNTPVNSNGIAMTVLPYTTPTVDITATDTVAWPGLLIRFNAVNVNGGAFPKYQWQLNNQNIVGAISDNWGTTTLANNDSVCVIMTPDFLCANPATAKACKRIRINTGIKGIIPSSMKIYPNPTNDVLFVEGAIVGTALRLVDVFGRVVSTINVKTDLEVLNLNALPSGIYLLSVATNNEIISITRIVKE